MKTTIGCILALYLAGCGQHYIVSDNTGAPQKIFVSAYSEIGCIETLNEEAAKQGVKVILTNQENDKKDWGTNWFPFVKHFKCTGEVLE